MQICPISGGLEERRKEKGKIAGRVQETEEENWGIGLTGGKRNGKGEDEDKVMMVIKTGGGEGEERTGFNGEKEELKRGKRGNRRRRKRKGEESGKK